MQEQIVTRTCRFEIDPRGFVRATMLEGVEMDLPDAVEALAATARVTEGRRLPVLVDSRLLKFQTRAAREHLAGPEAERVSTAVALLVGISPVSRVIGNFFLRGQTLRAPTRLFTDEDAAVSWLLDGARK